MDIYGVSMQVDMNELNHVRFQNKMVDKLFEINYEMYSPFVVEENAVHVLYVELLKIIYGMLIGACLFWEKLQSKLITEWKFVPNKCDECVVNKMVGGKQLTVAWHMDDLKVSHVDENAIENIFVTRNRNLARKPP